jgi:hypothetical protein
MTKIEIPLTALVSGACFWIGGMPLLLVWIAALIGWRCFAGKRIPQPAGTSCAAAPAAEPALPGRRLWNAGIEYAHDGTAINSLPGVARIKRPLGDRLRLWGVAALLWVTIFAIRAVWVLAVGS